MAARHIAGASIAALAMLPRSVFAQLSGELGAHDPSSLIKEGSTYYYFATGQGISSRKSTDMVNWSASPAIFSSPPAWTTTAVTNFAGFFWAPDVAYFNGQYHVYYSASNWGTIDSAIGLVTTPSLANPTWTDRGKVVQSDAVGQTSASTDTTAYNTIDPSVMVDNATGRVWMAFGSYSSGILVTELNPTTGLRLNTSTLAATQVANNSGGGWGSSIEGSALMKHGNYYYLLVNYGGCCSGVDSTYNIRMGRSTSPTGPFLDKDGVNMTAGGGSMFLDDDGKMIGPGHFSLYSENGQDYFGYHYYNGDSNGSPTYGLRDLYWTSDNWPSYASINPDWKGTSSANWSSALNWSAGGVPNGVGHVANFVSNSAGRYNVTIDSSNRTLSSLNFRSAASFTVGASNGYSILLDAQAGDSATLNVAQGDHTIAAPMIASDRLGVNISSATHLSLGGSVSAPGLTKYGHGTLSFNGSVTVTGTTLVKWGFLEINGSLTTNQYTSLGQVAGEGGVMVLRGTGAFITTADLNVGDTGSASDAARGWLEIHDNASVTVNAGGGFFVGSGYSANTRAGGTVTQDGGTLAVTNSGDGYFIIGGRASALGAGTYNLSNGTVNANTNIRVGGYGTGTMNQSGGAFNTSKYLSIGRYSGATGVYTISGGTLNQTGTSTAIIVGEVGTGTLNISGTGSVGAAGGVNIGWSGGAGVVNLNGGTLTTTQLAKGSGTASINFDGGKVRASVNKTTFLPNTITTTIEDGGGTIDTNGFSITVATPFLHDASLGTTADGGITKTGAGTLVLSGSSTYTGKTNVSGGLLTIGGSVWSSANWNVYTGSVNVTGAVAASGTAIIGSLAGGAGALSVQPSATMTAGTLLVGSGGSPGAVATGTATLASGAVVSVGQWLSVGHSGAAGSGGSFTVGGTLNIHTNAAASGALEVGVWDTASGTLTISAGSGVNLYNNASIVLGVQGNHTGTSIVNQNGGSVTFYSDSGVTLGGTGRLTLASANNPTGNYTYNLNGGMLTIPSIGRDSTAGNPATAFNFNGGTLKPTGSSTTFLQGLGSASIKAGGALIDSGAYGITIAQPLLHDAALGAGADGGLSKSGVGTLTLSGASTYSGPTNVTAGTLALSGTYAPAAAGSASLSVTGTANATLSGTATFTAVRGTNVSLTGQGLLTIAPSDADAGGAGAQGAAASVSKITNLSIATSARLDLKNNALIIPGTGTFNGTTLSVSALRSRLMSARGTTGTGGATWTGAGGIGSSSFTLESANSIGYVWNADPNLLILGGITGVNGQPVNSTDYAVKFTRAGDANLDGVVDNIDVGIVGLRYLNSLGNQWYQGDFNYDGVVNNDDVAILGLSYAPSGTPLSPGYRAPLAESSAASVVPDPTGVSIWAISAMVLLRRRRNS